MNQELQAYIDKIPEIVSDALPKLEQLGCNFWDINEKELNMDEYCDCIFRQLFPDSVLSRLSIIKKCPDGYFEVPDLPVNESSFFSFIDTVAFALFAIKYNSTLTAEYKKQIKQWKKNWVLKKPKVIIIDIPAIRERKWFKAKATIMMWTRAPVIVSSVGGFIVGWLIMSLLLML